MPLPDGAGRGTARQLRASHPEIGLGVLTAGRGWRGAVGATPLAELPRSAAWTGSVRHAWREASSTTVMSEGAPTRTGGPQAPAPRDT